MKITILLAIFSVWFLPGLISPAYAATCGAANQRPCKVWERIPSCNKGLKEDFKKNRCVRPRKPRPPRCGALNQRPCKVWERVPSCNRGLVENFKRGRCERPKRLNCGAQNQRPCKVWERVPSCNKGLVENFARGRCEKPKPLSCGDLNKAPCKLWERVPSCNNGLVENFALGKCVKGPHHREFQLANKKLAEISSVIAQQLNIANRLANTAAIIQALQRKDKAALARAVKRFIAPRPLLLPGGERLRTVSVGIGSNVKLLVGGSGSAGFALDLTNLHRSPAVYPYFSADYGVNLAVAAGGDLDLGFWSCQANKIGGKAWGIEVGVADIVALGKVAKGLSKFADAVKPGPDIGITLWFDYSNKFQGFTITPGISAGLDFGGYIRGQTEVPGGVSC